MDKTKVSLTAIALSIALLVIGIAPPSAYCAELNAVQSGSVTLAGGSTTVTAAITAVDLSRSFLVFTMRLNNANPQHGQVVGQLTDATTITFRRHNSNGDINIEWYVAEFTSGVTVQRGSEAMSGSSNNITLSNVDLTKSVPIISFRGSGSRYDNNDFIRARITTTTNLELSMQGSATGGATCEWQVVEFTDANVQTGDLSFATGSTSENATVSSVNTAKSWLIYTYNNETGTAANISQKLVRGLITDATTLTFDRDNTGNSFDFDLSWFLVEFTDGTNVAHNSEHFSTTDTFKDIPLSGVDTARSIAAAGYMMRGGKSTYQGNDDPGVAWVTADFVSANTLRLQRNVTASATADIGWFVVDFAPQGNTPPFVANPIPDTTMVMNSAPAPNFRDLTHVFSDTQDGSDLFYAVQNNSNPALITPTINPDSTLALSVAPAMVGTATIVIRAFDSSLMFFADDSFVVTVFDAGAPPVVVNAIPDTTIAEDSSPIVYRNMTHVFFDPEDGTALSYTVDANDNPTLVNATTNPDATLGLSFGANMTGTATIVIRATDSFGFFVDAEFEIFVFPILTGLGDGVVPPRTVLHQNHPNPFNPMTTITYELAVSGRALVKIYNLRGKEIRTLVDRAQAAGPSAVVWDGRNNAGGRVSSGVYFYRLQVGAFTATRKLVLIE